MAVVEKDAAVVGEREEENNTQCSPVEKKKRTKDPGVRVKGARIYDSEHGKTCHQCRQKTRDFAAFCKMSKNDKPCTLWFCHKCLLNRYGEKADEVRKMTEWFCPRCRGVCNCSFCMKKRGYQPTGILANTAKSTGFNSVHDLLNNKGSEVLEPQIMDSTASPKKSPLANKGLPASKRGRDKENKGVEQNEAEPNEEGLAKKEKKKRAKRSENGGSNTSQVPVAADGGIAEARPPKVRKLKKGGSDKEHKLTEADTNDKDGEEDLTSAGQNHGNSNEEKGNVGTAKAELLSNVGKLKRHVVKVHAELRREEIVLPQGSSLSEVVGIELSAQDVGAALQFLEFCNAFSEVLDIKKGQPECILRDLTRVRVKRHGVYSSHVDFNIKLLSLLEEKDMKKDEDEWVQTLKRCIEESECTLEELSLEFLDRGASGYNNLEPSEKLKILNFLCDEVLVTVELRNWIDEVAAKFVEGRKEHKEKVLAAKKKEKDLKQKVKNETAKAVLSHTGGLPLTLPEFDSLLSQLRTKADKVHAEVLSCLELVPKKNQRSDAVRTDHVILGCNGKIFWKLSGYNSRSSIILQDIGNWDSVTPKDKWFIYNEEEEKVVEKYISSLRGIGSLVSQTKQGCIQQLVALDFPHSEGCPSSISTTVLTF